MTNRNPRLSSISICAVLSLVLFASAGYANVLTTGGCAGAGTVGCPGTVTDFGTDPGFFPTTVLANTGVLAFTAVGGLFSGTVDEIVARDSVTGFLDFIFQVHNNLVSTDAIGRVTTNNFDSFTTDVGYSSTVFITIMGAGTRVPSTVDRLTTDVVGFNFADVLLGGIKPGQTSDLLVIKTNASAFGPGKVNFLDGDIAQTNVFAPTAVPEPTSLLLLGSGFFVAALWRKRMFRRVNR